MSDNDLIRRGDVRTRVCIMECAARGCESKCNLMDAVDATPPIDAVEVVRCKDCKHRRNSKQGWYCGYEYDRSDPYEMTRRADDEDYYCADGERKMYKSPIEIVDALQEKVTVSLEKVTVSLEKVTVSLENNVVRAVQAVGINIDKHELIAALKQDKSRYEAAYEQGKRDAAVEVVRCRDCMVLQWCRFAQGLGLDGFCSQGKRREE